MITLCRILFINICSKSLALIQNLTICKTLNAKCAQFNSSVYCAGSSRVNTFNYPLGGRAKNWRLPPAKLVLPIILHLWRSSGTGILHITQWKTAPFYPFLLDYLSFPILKHRWRKECFKRGAGATSCFGPDFIGSVELWLFDFNDFNTWTGANWWSWREGASSEADWHQHPGIQSRVPRQISS